MRLVLWRSDCFFGIVLVFQFPFVVWFFSGDFSLEKVVAKEPDLQTPNTFIIERVFATTL